MVVGSTGLIGSSLVHQLIEGGEPVKALTRGDQLTSNSILEYIKVDFDALELNSESFSDIKDIYICLGTTIKKAGSKAAFQKVDIQYCIDVAREAEKNGVRNLSVITSVGSDSGSSNFYLKTKGLIEEKISGLNFDSISIHRPGLLIGSRKESRAGESIGQILQPFLVNPFLIGSLTKYRSVESEVLAKAMIRLSGFKEGVNFYYFDDFFDKKTI
ncbi:NAD(P)H-binding protein [bacterium]|nr:NAD(P)H-binding protein [bacterium]